MKNYLYIAFFFSVLFLTACEDQQILVPDTTYEEFLVVQSELQGNTEFKGVRLTKTLPLGIPFTIENAEIKDAIMYMRINEAQIIPLYYKSEGMYYSSYKFTVHAGDTYELFGERGSRTFYAKTLVPFQPVVKSISYNSTGHFAEAILNYFDGEVYGALWVVNAAGFVTADNFYNTSVPDAHLNLTDINVRTAAFPENYQSSNFNGRRYIQVYAFDKSFDDYFKTSGQSKSINNPYVKGSGNTVWNIEGNKVIGMFIGVTKSDFIFVN